MNRSLSVPWLVTLAFVLLFVALPVVRSAQDNPGEEIERNLQAFHSDDDFIIYGAVNALGKIGSPAVPYLIELFETGNLEIRYIAAKALNSIGEQAALALPSALACR